jgi:hypothetical protein
MLLLVGLRRTGDEDRSTIVVETQLLAVFHTSTVSQIAPPKRSGSLTMPWQAQ